MAEEVGEVEYSALRCVNKGPSARDGAAIAAKLYNHTK